jgi:AraC-like DNA-binding protein
MLVEGGADPAAVVRDAGVGPEALTGPITAPLYRVRRLVDLAATRLDAPLFGLDLATRVQTGVYGIPEFLVRSAPTVERALQTICEFAVLVNPVLDFRLDLDEREARLRYAVPSERDALGAQINEYSIAFLVRQAAAVLDQPLPLTRAWFAHARPSHAHEVAARFGCDTAFQTADCGFAIPSAMLGRAPRTADPPLFEFLRAQALTQLANLAADDIVSQIARAIEARLPDHDFSAAAIARALTIPLRTLQRHLTEAGTSHRDVLSHVRLRRRATLRSEGMDSGPKLARELGFSDVRAMRRALDEPAD